MVGEVLLNALRGAREPPTQAEKERIHKDAENQPRHPQAEDRDQTELGYGVEQQRQDAQREAPEEGEAERDAHLDDDKTGPMEQAFVHLTGGMSRVNPGRVNSGAEFREYLTKAGFADIETSEFVPGHIGKVTARKPK